MNTQPFVMGRSFRIERDPVDGGARVQTMARQDVVHDRPPVWDRCIAKFGAAAIVGRPVIFSWGSRIYNPTGTSICRELAAHEAEHGRRQLAFAHAAGLNDEDGVAMWWERYLEDRLFRLDEEIYAHHVEYVAYRKRHGARPADLRMIAHRLSGPLYGNLLTFAQAKHAILTGEVG